MAFRQVTIANCKLASIRKAPWIPLIDKEIVGIRDGPNEYRSIEQGKTIQVDIDEVSYDWTGRKFYKVKHPNGWIYEGCLDLGDTSE